MDTQTLWLVIRSAISLVALGTMIAFMMHRNLKQYRQTNRFNKARMLMAFSFVCSFFSHVILLGYHGLEIQQFEQLIGVTIMEFSINTVLIAGTIMFSSMFAAYINRWESLVLFPTFLYAGVIVMNILIPEINFVTYYIFTFGVASIIALFEAGIRLKDNMGLGIGIMSFTQMVASFGGFWFSTAMSLASLTFGAITITGLFRPFGRQEV